MALTQQGDLAEHLPRPQLGDDTGIALLTGPDFDVAAIHQIGAVTGLALTEDAGASVYRFSFPV